ncbi:hypothetical protein CPter291_2480 [Collimonas pratensis]|uniref:Uncharacterized protein n=1 Tax=Collimonas pratensis TaxID=279113 RepID=A0ABM5Z6P5_9BURK|nr:hypothetical protein CPter291_2480 [Collimonas pratensis]
MKIRDNSVMESHLPLSTQAYHCVRGNGALRPIQPTIN